MRKIFLSVMSLCIFFSIISPGVLGASNNKSETIDQQLEKLKKEKDAAKKQANQALSRIKEIGKEKKKAEQDMYVLLKQIDETSGDLMNIQSKIDTTEQKLAETENQLEIAIHHTEERNEQVQSKVVIMYKRGFLSYLDVLLKSTTFSDFLQRLDSLLFIIRKEKELFKVAKREEEMVEQKKQEVEQLLSELTSNYNELSSIRQTLQIKEKNKEVLIASLESEVEELEELTEEQEAFLLQLARKESELLKKKSTSVKKQGTNSSPGKYAYPLVKKARLSSDFGTRTDPVTGKKGASHKGVDFAAHAGTDIIASKDGTVIVTDWISGYSNTVIIDHGEGIWTLYAHMRSISARQGSKVKKGEIIGEVGSTGKATGNNLHFEVRVNEKAVDPKPYLGL